MKIIKVINKNGVYCTPKLDITISEWKEMLLNEDMNIDPEVTDYREV